MKNLNQLIGVSVASLMAMNSFAQQAQKRPNIIWISTEDMSPHLGCYGDKVAKTPILTSWLHRGSASLMFLQLLP
jgi:hypothetical protein